MHFIPRQIFLECRINMTVLTILFLKLFNEFLVFSNCFGDKKTPFQMDMQINSWFFSYCGGLSFQSNPIFKSYCKRHNGLICWFLSSKVPKKKRLNFEFDFNHWVLYVRLAKRTDFSIIDPKKTFFHPFQGIYCNYYEKIRQKCDLVIFFDWGVIWLIWLYLSMYFSTPNMVKWVIPEKILQNAVQMRLS